MIRAEELRGDLGKDCKLYYHSRTGVDDGAMKALEVCVKAFEAFDVTFDHYLIPVR